MIVYAASDLHGELPDPPDDAELLLLAGDICPNFGGYGKRRGSLARDGLAQRDWLIKDFASWTTNFKGDIVMTWGNHDFVGEKPWLVKDFMAATAGNVYLLNDSAAVVRGLRIWGTPWVPALPYWAFFSRKEGLEARASLIPLDLDVLMTHGPPRFAGDYIPGGTEKQISKYGNLHGMNVGDPSLNAAILRVKPRVTICGHIHEARGHYDVRGNPVVNVAAVDAAYVLHPQPFTRLYELEDRNG